MPLYEYVCPSCGCISSINKTIEEYSLLSNASIWCPYDNTKVVRKYSFSIQSSMPEHYNPSVGQHVSTKRQFKDELKRQEEDHYLTTGFEAKYSEVDMSEPSALGVTEEGLDSTYRQLVKEGKKEVKQYL